MSRDYVKKKPSGPKTSETSSSTSDKETERDKRRRRAERNRLRTIKYVHKLLDQVVEGVSDGFNHHGWCNAATSLKMAATYLEPQEHEAIGASWAPLYAEEDGSSEHLVYVISRIKERIAGNLLERL